MFQRLKSLFAAKPPVEFRHPELGVLTLDSGVWSGELQRDGRRLRFYVGGTDATPDTGLLDRVGELARRFPEVERNALEFLCKQEAGVRPEHFKFSAFDFLWEDKPHLYTLEFTLEGDDDGIWRVEFENGQPKHIGRDD